GLRQIGGLLSVEGHDREAGPRWYANIISVENGVAKVAPTFGLMTYDVLGMGGDIWFEEGGLHERATATVLERATAEAKLWDQHGARLQAELDRLHLILAA